MARIPAEELERLKAEIAVEPQRPRRRTAPELIALRERVYTALGMSA